MNLFRREMRANLRSLVIWALSVAALSVLVMSIYPSIARDAAKFEELLASYPKQIIQALGLNQVDLADPLGLYATESYLWVTLLGGLFAAILGASLLAKEEDEKTVEYLLARPISRGRVVAEKALTYLVYLVAFNLVAALSAYAAFGAFVERAWSGKVLLLLLVAPFFVHLAFASLGLLSGLFWTRRRSVYSVSVGLVVGTYFLGMVAGLAKGHEWLRWLSPFSYVSATDIVAKQALNWGNLLILVVVSAAALGGAYLLYRRRDISV